ncbi:PREDICTED: histone deacetylase complex subunit SAP30 [Galeopterus variegatus]|uniref:Histone deacetylase complex subunit SAP30 n=1 Tax=Galeopterus variegatus TaxID=482537 RepID=A0ABM0RPB4_GALVR|nr:PREDICTED: histone deacetylase complex subunit SAP30 [Galeopterus variegatus]
MHAHKRVRMTRAMRLLSPLSLHRTKAGKFEESSSELGAGGIPRSLLHDIRLRPSSDPFEEILKRLAVEAKSSPLLSTNQQLHIRKRQTFFRSPVTSSEHVCEILELSPSQLPYRDRRRENTARHLYICDYHKNLIQSVRNRRKRKGSDDDGGDSPVQDIDTPEVDLYQLQVNTLRRYKRHFKLPTRPGLNKAQLVEIVGCHFRSIPVNEKDTLTYFIYSVKNDKNKSDLKVDSGVH